MSSTKPPSPESPQSSGLPPVQRPSTPPPHDSAPPLVKVRPPQALRTAPQCVPSPSRLLSAPSHDTPQARPAEHTIQALLEALLPVRALPVHDESEAGPIALDPDRVAELARLMIPSVPPSARPGSPSAPPVRGPQALLA